MTRWILQGGTVLDQRGERLADVAVEDGRIIEVGDHRAPSGRRGARRHRLSRDARIRRPPRPPPRARPGGGRDDRDRQPRRCARRLHRDRRDAQHRTRRTTPSPSSSSSAPRATRAGLCEVAAGGLHHDGSGRRRTLAPLGELAAAGVHLFTDDGNGVQDPALMRRALEYARPLGITLAQHCEVASLTKGAVMHEGSCCSHLGLPGWPAIAEELMVHRDIELVRLTGGRCTSSTCPRRAASRSSGQRRPRGCRSPPRPRRTTSPSPTSCSRSFDAVYKVNPPLRTAADIAAIKAGLADGTIDAIATDHAPHPPGVEGGAARPGATGHARPGDRTGPRRSPSSTCRWPTWSPL